jgi:hypothetical protein
MARRPASRISVQNGRLFQMCISIEKPSASVGSFSQFGPSSPVSLKMVLLITPHSGLSMKRTDRMVGIDGTAQGRMNSSRQDLDPPARLHEEARQASAMAIFRLMATTRKTTVLIAVRKKIGSSNSLT